MEEIMSDDSSVEFVRETKPAAEKRKEPPAHQEVIELLDSSSSEEEESTTQSSRPGEASGVARAAAPAAAASSHRRPSVAASSGSVPLRNGWSDHRKQPPSGSRLEESIYLSSSNEDSDDDSDVRIVPPPAVPVGIRYRGNNTREFPLPIYENRQPGGGGGSSQKKSPAKRKHDSSDDEKEQVLQESRTVTGTGSDSKSRSSKHPPPVGKLVFQGQEIDSSDDEMATIIDRTKPDLAVAAVEQSQRNLAISHRSAAVPHMNREETKQARREKAEERNRQKQVALSPLRNSLSPAARGGSSFAAAGNLSLVAERQQSPKGRLPTGNLKSPGQARLRLVPKRGKRSRAMGGTNEEPKAAAAMPLKASPFQGPLSDKTTSRPPRPDVAAKSRPALQKLLHQDDQSTEGSRAAALDEFEDAKPRARSMDEDEESAGSGGTAPLEEDEVGFGDSDDPFSPDFVPDSGELIVFDFDDDFVVDGGVSSQRLTVLSGYEDQKSSVLARTEYDESQEAEEEPGAENEIAELDPMHVVDHLSRLSVDEQTGYPVYEFTAYFRQQDDVLYYFVVNIRKSTIVGAGRGAFLSFVGVRRLRPEQLDKTIKLYEERELFQNPTQKTLFGRTAAGTKFAVHLQGSNLHGNNNNHCWPKKMFKLFLRNLDYDTDFIGKKDIAVEDGIGAVGIYREEDYQLDNSTRKFPPPKKAPFCVYLAAYGPFRKEDRKTESLFTLKGFAFRKVPDEWGFDIAERYQGEIQICDITCDRTGVPHEIAMKRIAPYVNEIAHNPDLQQNVFVCQHNDSSVHYYIKFGEGCTLAKGSAMELFTNYTPSYEHVRRRKGFGHDNIHAGLKSDADPIRWLQLSLGDREDAENVIFDTPCCSVLVDHIEFFSEAWESVSKRCSAYLHSPSDAPMPSAEEWTAWIRIPWMRSKWNEQIDHIAEAQLKELKVLTLEGTSYPYIGSFEYCHELMKPMCATFSREQLVAGERSDAGFSLVGLIRQEFASENLYSLRETILLPLDETVWCPRAARLMKSLAEALADSLIAVSPAVRLSRQDKQPLLENWIKIARLEVQEIRESLKKGMVPDDLTFAAGVDDGCLPASVGELLRATKCSKSFFLDNTCTPKGCTAAVLQKLAYVDALVAAGLEPQLSRHDVKLDASERYVMVETPLPQENDGLCSRLASHPQSRSSLPKTSARANETWYLTWQVAYVVYAFVSAFVMDDVDISLEQLCDRIGVDFEPVRFAVARGMKKEHDKKLREQLVRGSTFKAITKPAVASGSTKKRRGGKAKAPLKAANSKKKKAPVKKKQGGGGRPKAKCVKEGVPGPERYPFGIGAWPLGWTKKVFERQSGATKGDFDNYWYTPKKQLKLRSLTEVKRFVIKLKSCGDEEQAWKAAKSR